MPNRQHMRIFLRRSAALGAFVGLLWVIQLVNWILGDDLNSAFGLIPRQVTGLDGIVAMPLLHGNFAHLVANTPPLLVMGGLLVVTAPTERAEAFSLGFEPPLFGFALHGPCIVLGQ